MFDEYEVYIHVGYPKAASTTLQKHLFCDLEGFLNLGVYPTNNIGMDSEYVDHSVHYLKFHELRGLYEDLVTSDEIEFSNSNFESRMRALISKAQPNSKILLSNEKLTSVFFAHRDNGLKAKRLAALFPKAKIIFILRNQYDWLRSQYRDHPFDPRELTIGKGVGFNDWFKIICWHQQIKVKPMLDYYSIVKFYENLFGKENVSVHLFEDVVHNMNKFSKDISLFLGVDEKQVSSCLSGKHENNGVPNKFNRYRMLKRGRLSQVIPQWLDRLLGRFLITGDKKMYKLSDENELRLDKIFGRGNKQLMVEYGLELDNYSYPGCVKEND